MPTDRMEDPEAVPAAARLLRDFVNTAEPQTGEEKFTTPAALGRWCHERGLMPAKAVLTQPDLTVAFAVRDGLRAVLQVHADHEAPQDALSALEVALDSVPLRACFDRSGELRLRSAGDRPVAAVIASLLDAVRIAGSDGSWERLKVCGRDSCRWAFYDTSRNRSGRWCSMAGCGNLVKMQRAHARRRRASSNTPAG